MSDEPGDDRYLPWLLAAILLLLLIGGGVYVQFRAVQAERIAVMERDRAEQAREEARRAQEEAEQLRLRLEKEAAKP